MTFSFQGNELGGEIKQVFKDSLESPYKNGEKVDGLAIRLGMSVHYITEEDANNLFLALKQFRDHGII